MMNFNTKFNGGTDPKNSNAISVTEEARIKKMLESGYMYSPTPVGDSYFAIVEKDSINTNRFLVKDPNYKQPGVDMVPNPLGSPTILKGGRVIQQGQIQPITGTPPPGSFTRNTTFSKKRTKFSGG